MTNVATNVFVTKGGTVSVGDASEGFVVPVDITDPATGTDLGYMTTDGAPSITPSSSTEAINVWQDNDQVDIAITEAAVTITFTCAESKKETLEYAFGVDFTAGYGDYSPADGRDRRPLDITLVSRRGQLKRYVAPESEVTELGEITSEYGTVLGYSVTAVTYPSALINGKYVRIFDSAVTPPEIP